MKFKIIAVIMSIFLLVPTFTEARGFSGGSRSSFSSHSSTRTSSFSNHSSSSYSKPKVNLSKGSSSKSSTSKSFSGSSSTKKSTTKNKSNSFSGKSSNKSTTTKKSGAFSGKTSTVRGRTYTSTPTRRYYNGRYVSINHYYSAGYTPYGWFGYYHGFSTGMFMGSMLHPWGGVYIVSGHPISYGVSPLAWIIDLIVLGVLIVIVVFIIKATKSRKIYTRRF